MIDIGGDYLNREQLVLLIINERLYKTGQIDKNTKERMEMEIKTNKEYTGIIDSACG